MDIQLSDEERTYLTSLVIGVLDDWGIEQKDQVALLGIPNARPREITRLRRGAALPQDEAVIERCKHILGIHHALQLVFPHNPHMPNFWVTCTNRQFNKTPLEVMLEEGIDGIRRVRGHLDCTSTWD